MIDKKWIGHELPEAVLPLERTRLKFFAQAIGQTDPIYSDEVAARAAGYPDLPAPPTFLFGAQLDSGTMVSLVNALQLDLGKILHGEETFTYHQPACVGDTITVRGKIADIYDKKNGALEFIVTDSQATNQKGELVAELRQNVIYRP